MSSVSPSNNCSSLRVWGGGITLSLTVVAVFLKGLSSTFSFAFAYSYTIYWCSVSHFLQLRHEYTVILGVVILVRWSQHNIAESERKLPNLYLWYTWKQKSQKRNFSVLLSSSTANRMGNVCSFCSLWTSSKKNSYAVFWSRELIWLAFGAGERSANNLQS